MMHRYNEKIIAEFQTWEEMKRKRRHAYLGTARCMGEPKYVGSETRLSTGGKIAKTN